MRIAVVLTLLCVLGADLLAQQAIDVPPPEQKEKEDKEKQKLEKQQEKRARKSSTIEFVGVEAFKEKELQSQLKEQITTVDDFGLTPARADDVAFFLELFYRKHGYSKVNVRYAIESGDRLRLEVDEGALTTLANISFDGNVHEPTEKLFEYAVGPTRERYSKLQKNLPFVEADLREGADLIHRFYVAQGFLDSKVEEPRHEYIEDGARVNVFISVHEGRQYFFGDVSFTGQTLFGAEELRAQMLDLVSQPYTDARVADIPRRIQTYFKERGYYDVKVEAIGDPARSSNGRIPVQVVVAPGPLYHFDGATVKGLERLHPSYVTKRFNSLSGKTYNPKLLDERFREMMRTGLFSVLQIKPTPINGNLLHLEISAEEANPKEVGVSVGYGSFTGAIVGAQFRDRNLFGYGRPFTVSAEWSQRGYKGEIGWEDPYFLDTDFEFKARLSALTYDFDGYSKFELGGRIEFARDITKQYRVGIFQSTRHVEITSADIKPAFLGNTSYFASSFGVTQTLDLRESPLVAPRGLVLSNTVDWGSPIVGSEIDFIRGIARASYFLPFGPKPLTPGITEEKTGSAIQRWIRGSGIAFGARAGVIQATDQNGNRLADLPIDERFFNGGSTTVRSFTERDLGPHDRKGNPLGGEFFTVFNVEYTFPIFGELQGALFADAGNLLPQATDPGLDDMRYALGVGIRYKLPIGPIRFDYGFNPSPKGEEAAGAFHFSFGFAF